MREADGVSLPAASILIKARRLVPSSSLSWPWRLLRLAGAYTCVSSGIALMIRSKFGVAPIDSLIKGLSDRIGVSFGIAFIGVSILFFAIGWMLNSPPGPGSLLGSFVIGPAIDALLNVVNEPTNTIVRLLYLVVGIVVVAVGVSLAISTDLGAGPNEVIMLGVHSKGVPLVAARWVIDGIQLLVSFLLGGPLGLGTVLFLIGMSPLIKWCLRVLRYSPAVA